MMQLVSRKAMLWARNFRSGKPAKRGPLKEVRARLNALVDEQDRAVLTELFERMDSLEHGVDSRRFRVDFKGDRERIDRLKDSFVLEDRGHPGGIYRPSLVALPLIGDERAQSLLELIDRELRYLAAEYESEPGRKVYLSEISENLDEPEERVAEALAYFVNGPVSMARKTGYPEGPEWFVIPDEEMLDHPDLDSVLAQMATHVERSANESARLFYGIFSETPLWPSNRNTSWWTTHKKTTIGFASAAIGTGLAVLANLAAVIDFLSRLFGHG